jgi:hypothetical protein
MKQARANGRKSRHSRVNEDGYLSINSTVPRCRAHPAAPGGRTSMRATSAGSPIACRIDLPRANASPPPMRCDRAAPRRRGSAESIVAGSATTRSRRQAGPPPFAIDWRTSTTSSMADRTVARDMHLEPRPDARRLARLFGDDQCRLAPGQGDQLGVEQIGGDGIGEADLVGRHFDDLDFGHCGARDRRRSGPYRQRHARARTIRGRWRRRRHRCGTRRRRSPRRIAGRTGSGRSRGHGVARRRGWPRDAGGRGRGRRTCHRRRLLRRAHRALGARRI